MKDSYTLDLDTSGLDSAYEMHRRAYHTIFKRLGLDVVAVDASVGTMGGSGSTEFMVFSPAGEDDIAVCPACDYAANVETATTSIPAVVDPIDPSPVEEFATPDVRTIAQLVDVDGGAPADRQIKTLVYLLDEVPVLVLLRGDHDLVEQKLIDGTGTHAVRPAGPDEILDLLGANAGSLGPVGVSGVRVIADPALAGRRLLTTGANRDDFHIRNVDVERDVVVDEWLDLRLVKAGESCPNCGQPVHVERAIEVGHIFKLGTEFSDVLGVSVLDEDGVERPVVMGSYGIGVERAVAAIVELHHDDSGIVWPVAMAPWEVVITTIRGDDPQVAAAAHEMYEALLTRGIEVLLDDRDERPGVKFADAELVGIPYRVTLGPRGLDAGNCEVVERASGDKTETAIADAVSVVATLVEDAR